MGKYGENNGIRASLTSLSKETKKSDQLSIIDLERDGMKAIQVDKDTERRIEKRYICSEDIFFATQTRLYEGKLKDYSRNGLFIRTKEALSVGETITVVDPHPSGDNKKRKGQILWRNKEGFGVELYRQRSDMGQKIIQFEKRRI
jgi:hypothetical protein